MSLRGRGPGAGGHGLAPGASEAADDDGVEGAVPGEQGLGLVAVGGGDADGSLGLAEAVEVVAVALVQVAVEGLLLGQALGGVGPARGADGAQDRRRVARR